MGYCFAEKSAFFLSVRVLPPSPFPRTKPSSSVRAELCMCGTAEGYSFGFVMRMLKEEGRVVWWKRIMAYQAGSAFSGKMCAFLERDLGRKKFEKGRKLLDRSIEPSSSSDKRSPCLLLGS